MSCPVNERTIRTPVFPVAGMGNRFLPATKAMPKELLPPIGKPMDAVPFYCHRNDCGSKLGYIEEIPEHALRHEEFGSPVQAFIQDRITALSSEGGELRDSQTVLKN